MITCASLVLGLHLVSHHSHDSYHQNNINPGVYAECDGWTAGAYRNTLDRVSVYAGYSFKHGPFALNLGAVSGYQKEYGQKYCEPGKKDVPWARCYLGAAHSHVIPMISPSVQIGPARLWYIPGVGESASVIHLSLQKEWK